MAFVTFIIPSLGRKTLINSLKSLLAQTDEDWQCLVVFDGVNVETNDISFDERIKYIVTDKKGNAGEVRNVGLCLLTTPWAAFLDDDDTLGENYVKFLKKYVHDDDDDLQLVYFSSMRFNRKVPNQKATKLCDCKFTGMITFAVQTDFIQKNKIIFGNTKSEDRKFLYRCLENNVKYVISREAQYICGKPMNWSSGTLLSSKKFKMF